MAGAARLRVIDGGREPRVAVADAPELYGLAAPDRIPPARNPFAGVRLLVAAIISVALHGGAIWWGLQHRPDEEARAAGGASDTIVIEGESVILVDSVPSDASQSLPEAKTVTETRTAAVTPTEAPVEMAAPPLAATGDISIAPSDAAAAPVARDEQTQRVVEDRPVAAAEIDASAPPDDAVAHAIEEAAARPVVDTAKPVAEESPTASAPVIDSAKPADAQPTKIAADTVRPVSEDATPVVPEDASRAIVEHTPRLVDDAPATVPDETPKPVAEDPPPKPAAKPKPAPRSESRPASVANDAARGPAPGSAGAGGASNEESGRADMSGYQAKLAAHLRRYRSFPAEARDRGISGTATVRFTVNRGGAVIGASLAKSSGSGVLDQAAVAMVYRASPFPPIPSGFAAGTLTVNVPVRFDLR